MVRTEHFDPALIDQLHYAKLIWAINDKTLAVGRTSIQNDKQQVGVTLVPCDGSPIRPRILAAEQEGFFWLGASYQDASRVVAVANPLEAFAYRQAFLLKQQDNAGSESVDAELLENPHIISLDQHVPPGFLIRHIVKARKNLIMATHAPTRWTQLQAQIAALADQPSQETDWLELEVAEMKPNPITADRAWSRFYLEKLHREQARIKAIGPRKPGDAT